MARNLTGTFRVRVFRPAFQEARSLFPRSRDMGRLGKHALKLRFWPQCHPQNVAGQLLDLDWEFIKSLAGSKVGELRIHDRINGNDNLRIIFLVAPEQSSSEMPVIWILAVMQKKSNDFSRANIQTFRMRRQLVLNRFYGVETNLFCP